MAYTYLKHRFPDYCGNQEELARKIGVSQPYISMVLQGKKKPTRSIATKLSNELGINIKELISEPNYAQ